jgi:pimeloyl-ACP methyl ester carboxylesterase
VKIRLEERFIQVRDRTIHGSLLTPESAMPGVLFVHGWGGSQASDLGRARTAVELGCVCLTFDLRGHSKTEADRATVTREDNLDDLLAAYDLFVREGNVDASHIAVVGYSYGAYLAAILTSLRPVRWLAMLAPALYKDEDWNLPKHLLNEDPGLAEFRHGQVLPPQSRALRACAAFEGDALVVELEKDERISPQIIKNYISAFTHPHSLTSRMVRGADHALTSKECQAAYTSILMKWLTEMITGARSQAVPEGTPAAG